MQRLNLFRSAEKKYLMTLYKDPVQSAILFQKYDPETSLPCKQLVRSKSFSSSNRGPHDSDKESDRGQQLVDRCFSKSPTSHRNPVYGHEKQVAHILKVNEPVRCKIIIAHIFGESDGVPESATRRPSSENLKAPKPLNIEFVSTSEGGTKIDTTCDFQAMPKPRTAEENDLEFASRSLNTPHDYFQQDLIHNDGPQPVKSGPKIKIKKYAEDPNTLEEDEAEAVDQTRRKEVEYEGVGSVRVNEIFARAVDKQAVSGSHGSAPHIEQHGEPGTAAESPGDMSHAIQNYEKLAAKLLLMSRKPHKKRVDVYDRSREVKHKAAPTMAKRLTEKFRWLKSQSTKEAEKGSIAGAENYKHALNPPIDTVIQEIGMFGVPHTGKGGGFDDKDKPVKILRRPDWPGDKPEVEMAYKSKQNPKEKFEKCQDQNRSQSTRQETYNWHAYEPQTWHWNQCQPTTNNYESQNANWQASNWHGWVPNYTASHMNMVRGRTLDLYSGYTSPHHMYWYSLQSNEGSHENTDNKVVPSPLAPNIATDVRKVHTQSYDSGKGKETETMKESKDSEADRGQLFSKSFDEKPKKKSDEHKKPKKMFRTRITPTPGVVYSNLIGDSTKSAKRGWMKFSDPIVPIKKETELPSLKTTMKMNTKDETFTKQAAPKIVIDKVYSRPFDSDTAPAESSKWKPADKKHKQKLAPVTYISRDLKSNKYQEVHQQNKVLEPRETDARVLIRAYQFLAKEIPKYTSMAQDTKDRRDSPLLNKTDMEQIESRAEVLAKARADAIIFSRSIDCDAIKNQLTKERNEKHRQSHEAAVKIQNVESSPLESVVLATKLPPPFERKPKVSDVLPLPPETDKPLKKQPPKHDKHGRPLSPVRPHPAAVSLIPPMSSDVALPKPDDKSISLKELLDRVRKRNKILYRSQQMLATPKPDEEYCGDKVPPRPPPQLPCQPKETKHKPCPPTKDCPPAYPECPPPCTKPEPPKCTHCPPRFPPPCPCPPPLKCPPPPPKCPPPCPPPPKCPPPCPPPPKCPPPCPPPPKCPPPCPSPPKCPPPCPPPPKCPPPCPPPSKCPPPCPPPPKCPPPCPPPPKCPPPCPPPPKCPPPCPPPPKCPPPCPPPPKCPPPCRPPPKCPPPCPPCPKPCDPCKRMAHASAQEKITLLLYLASKHKPEKEPSKKGVPFDDGEESKAKQAVMHGIVIILLIALREMFRSTLQRRLYPKGVGSATKLPEAVETLSPQPSDVVELPRPLETLLCLRSKDYNPWVPIPSYPVPTKHSPKNPLDCLKKGERPPVCTVRDMECKSRSNLPCPRGFDKSCSGFPRHH